MPRRSRASRSLAIDRITTQLDAAAAKKDCPLVHVRVGDGPDTCPRCGRFQFWMAPAPTPSSSSTPTDIEDEQL